MTEQLLEQRIREIGRETFSTLSQFGPSTFKKNFWIGKVLELTIRNPQFKTNLFRLVDVLPALRTHSEIVDHVREYLAAPAAELHPLLALLLDAPRLSLRGQAGARAVRFGTRQIGQLFIAGEEPRQALPALRRLRQAGLAFTIDLLGEYCVSESEALAYQNRYLDALKILGREFCGTQPALIDGHPGEASPICISVKLTALYSQCSPLNKSRSVEIIGRRLSEIATAARTVNARLYVDAEDTANNEIIYSVFMELFASRAFADFPFPGIVLQSYARNSDRLLEELLSFAERRGSPIAVRLVKGAYWDMETVAARQGNLPSPLYSYKQSSDANFERLTRRLMDRAELALPAIASHNIRSLAHAVAYAERAAVGPERYELQMLYGMAEPIARSFASRGSLVRLYVPLGDMLVGMGYLVRRLLENTSNESFLRHTFFDRRRTDELLSRPEFHSTEQP